MLHLQQVFESCKSTSEKLTHLANIQEGYKRGEIVPLRDIKLSDALIGCCGKEVYERCKRNDGVNLFHQSVWEGVDGVNQTLFTNITQLLVLQGVVPSYESPDFIGTELVEFKSSPDDNVRIPGIHDIPLQTITVGEGEEYPEAGVSEDYIDTPRSVKNGMKIGITKEAIFFDKTGQLMERCAKVGDRVGTGRELRILRTVFGLDNTFSRGGTTRNTYVASADPRVNKKTSNPLVDWTSAETAFLLFTTMFDDRDIPEPIMVRPDTVIVPMQKLLTAKRIFGADGIRMPSETADGNNTTQTYSQNPLKNTPWGTPRVLTTPWLYYLLTLPTANSNPGGQRGQVNSLYNGAGLNAEQASNYWYIGNFKKAFKYREVWPLTVMTAPANNLAEFERDIMVQFRASERGVPYVEQPWQVVQNTND